MRKQKSEIELQLYAREECNERNRRSKFYVTQIKHGFNSTRFLKGGNKNLQSVVRFAGIGRASVVDDFALHEPSSRVPFLRPFHVRGD